jgi:hypothetical protein
MSSVGRVAVSIAIVLLLAPAASQISTNGAGIELARNGSPAYPPCAWAKPRQLCMNGTTLSANPPRRRWPR